MQAAQRSKYMKQSWIRINLVAITMNWLTCSINYYLISFIIKYLPGNMLVNNTMSSLSEIAGNILGAVLVKRLGAIRAF